MSILIANGTVITMDAADRIISRGAVYVEGNRIADIGSSEDLCRWHRADEVIDAHRMVVIPGLINCHTHIISTLMRGLGTDLPLFAWLRESNYPGRFLLTGDDAYITSLLGCMENLRSGSTCIVDFYHLIPRSRRSNVDRLAEAVEKGGIRGVLIRGYHNVESPGMKLPPDHVIESDEEVLGEYRRIIQAWHNKASARIKVWLGAAIVSTTTPELLVRIHALAEEHGLGLHIHTSETPGYVELCKKMHGKTEVELYHDLGVLGSNFHVVHGIWLSDHDIDLIRDTGSHVVHCPTANMYLGDGIAPIPKLMKAGINIALGADAPNCNNNLDMIQNMKFAACLQKAFALNPGVISAKDVLRMATVNGARALGLENEIGSLEVGKKADIVLIDMFKPHLTPMLDPVANLVYSANGNDVDSVIVDGKILLRNKVFTLDEPRLLDKAQEAAMSLRERINQYLANTPLKPSTESF